MNSNVTLGQLVRKTICDKADVFRAYDVTEIDGSVKNRTDAIARVIRRWHVGDFGDCFPTVREAFEVSNFEQSEVYRDLYASDLAMQLNRMARYLAEHHYKVELGISRAVTVGDGECSCQISGRIDMILRALDGTTTAVKIVAKQNYSSSARKAENLPENAPEIAWLNLCKEADGGALYSLAHKDDTSTRFAENYDEAIGKNGKVLTGKNIASATLDEASARQVLLSAIKEAEDSPDCECCECRELCKGNFIFRNRAAEAEVNKKAFSWSEEQQAVIRFREGNLAVLAGPGSGKTAVLVERYCELVRNGVNPLNILLLVFTNKVADEIRLRIAAQLGLDREQRNALNVMTINAFGQKLMNENPVAFDGPRVVADSGERKQILLEILFPPTEDGSDLMAMRHKYRNLYGEFYGLSSLNKQCERIDAGEDAEDLKLSEEDFEELKRVNEELHRRLESMNAITYDEQITLPLEHLKNHPEVAKLYHYIMVDEAQDLDEKQYELIRLLAIHGNLVMVGDDDQSIYRFRQGSSKYLLSFAKEEHTGIIVLHDNFRASELLNGVGNALISQSVEERQKKAYRYMNKGRKPEFITGKDILPAVVERLLSEGTKPSDIAILARTNKTLEDVAKSLVGIVECSNSKDYVREDAVFLFIRAALDMALHKEEAGGMSKYRFWRAFEDVPVGPIEHLPDEIMKKVDKLNEQLLIPPVEDAIEAFIESEVPSIPTSHPVLGMIKEWCEVKNLNEDTLLRFLNQMVRMSDDARIDYGADEGKVQLFTAHDSKGKEFPVVIIADAEAYEDEEGSSEELRLLYVAMTRAKTRLVVIGKDMDKPYLRFLRDRCVGFPSDNTERGGVAV